jgi:hypothetical protein
MGRALKRFFKRPFPTSASRENGVVDGHLPEAQPDLSRAQPQKKNLECRSRLEPYPVGFSFVERFEVG